MISRPVYLHDIQKKLRSFPVVSILGPRQVGKTTLARAIARNGSSCIFDLENPSDANRLSEPMTALESLRGLVVIDEVQRQPSLFPILRVLADRRPLRARFLILGSASPDLVRGVSESLAGRVAHVDLGGFDLSEVGVSKSRRLWWRGGFPRSFLAATDKVARDWQLEFARSFLERDIPQLGISMPAITLRRFWSMAAHFHGQAWNAAEFARSLGSSEPTARKYLDILTATFMIRQLPPWFENMGKRQIKAPKIYIRDSGLLHSLLGLNLFSALEGHPKLGASWEGFALEQVLRIYGDRQAWFWGTHAGAELDLMIVRNNRRIGFEFKYSDAPKPTKSMHTALQDLKLEKIHLVHPGNFSGPLDKKIRLLSIHDLPATLSK